MERTDAVVSPFPVVNDTSFLLCKATMALPAAARYVPVLALAAFMGIASGQHVSLNGANFTSMYPGVLTVNFTSGHVNKLGFNTTIGPLYEEISNMYTKSTIFQANGSNTSPNGGLGSICYIICYIIVVF